MLKRVVIYCLVCFGALAAVAPPLPPVSALAKPITLAWDEPNDQSVIGYQIYVSFPGSSFNFTVPKVSSYLFTNLFAGIKYQFYVTARNAVGLQSVPSNIASAVTVPMVPSIPSPFEVLALGTSELSGDRYRLNLEWNVSTNVGKFKVTLFDPSVPSTNYYVAIARTLYLTPLKNEVTYGITVTSLDVYGTESAPSAPVTVKHTYVKSPTGAISTTVVK